VLPRTRPRTPSLSARTPRVSTHPGLGQPQAASLPFCPGCGAPAPAGARFCPACGAELAQAAPVPQRRKLVTLLFCDMSGSTAMGERVDAESVREMMFSYFHEMRSAIERHGGTIEKFVGDAVMAVFGIPTAHEDDAMRAVRAAWEMQQRMPALNDELERRYGSRIALRIGVNTGEVIAGDASTRETMVTGDAVNVAARLEQTATPGEVLLGEPTFRLVRPLVEAAAVEPLELKGKSESVPAYRLTAVAGGTTAPPRPRGTALVGRDAELEALFSSLERVCEERSCLAVTLLGEPGVGKSRLTEEFLAGVGEATLLSGGCLSYGEGITFWPLAQVVHGATGVRDGDSSEEALARIQHVLEGERDGAGVARLIAVAIGLAEGAAAPAELSWAFRRLFEALAAERPLVITIEDLHWAEETLLELLAALPERCRAPVLLLATARPEFAESHPDWPGMELRLEPLGEEGSFALLGELLGTGSELESLRAQVGAAAAGNPLFAQELVAMLVDEGILVRGEQGPELVGDPGEIHVPPTIGALLGARLDLLSSDERTLAEAGSVEGQLFHRGAAASLLELGAPFELMASAERLVARELVQTAPAQFIGEAAYRFRHVLVRDAAYGAIAKKQRAQLHERFARWLERKIGSRLGEFEEILGFHLEQAVVYRSQLGPLDEAGEELRAAAIARLGSTGRRALDRGDAPAAVNLLERALVLATGSDAEEQLKRPLAAALVKLGELERADALLSEVVETAERRGDARQRLHALIEQELVRQQTAPEGRAEPVRTLVEQSVPVFEEHSDELGLARAFRLRSELDFAACRFGPCAETLERALVHAERSGDERERAEILVWLGTCLCWGPAPVREAIARCEAMLALPLASDFQWFESGVLGMLGFLHAMRGEFEQARDLTTGSRAILDELGLKLAAANRAPSAATIELWAGELATAEQILRESLDLFASMGERAVAGSVACYLAEVLAREGAVAEAERLLTEFESAASTEDVFTRVVWHSAASRLAARSEPDWAEALGREAVRLAATSDALAVHGDALLSLAELLLVLGRAGEVPEILDDAAFLFERKDHFVLSARTHALRLELAQASA
jgi:class 3 adenylate cyclase/tetratricopeptide (TPR) repeat protein